MDLLGTLSLLLDIPAFLTLVLGSSTSGGSFATSKTQGVSENVTRSVSVLRITKFARVLRVVRLIRVRLLRFLDCACVCVVD